MKKVGLLKSEKMGDYEKEQGFASYRTLCELFVGDMVLCNNIIDIDTSIYDNIENGTYYMDYTTGEEKTEEEYQNDTTGKIDIYYSDIYQYYLCNLNEYNKEFLFNAGFIISYSDMLECDVICVDHFGTSWDYVLTNVRLFDTYEELTKYENEEEEKGVEKNEI